MLSEIVQSLESHKGGDITGFEIGLSRFLKNLSSSASASYLFRQKPVKTFHHLTLGLLFRVPCILAWTVILSVYCADTIAIDLSLSALIS